MPDSEVMARALERALKAIGPDELSSRLKAPPELIQTRFSVLPSSPGAPMPARPHACLPALVALACLAVHSPAAGAASFSVDHAITLRQIQTPVWSRDGKSIAFVVNAPDTAENTTNQDVWVWDAATGAARQLTHNPKNDYAPQFSPGGDTLAFLSARDSDEGKASIWMLPLHGGEPWKLASFAETVGEIRWSPDGRSIAFTMLDTLPKQVKEWRKKKWDQVVEDEIPQYNHLWTIDVATGRQQRVTSGTFMVADSRMFSAVM